MTDLDSADIDGLVRPDKVHRRVFTDPDLFELEMERIFGRVWVYVGHESQVPVAGDWLRSRIGTHQVVVTRHDDGRIHVLRNRCTHRGMTVCKADRGNARRLVCPYHGWAFHHDGALAGVPHASGYAKGIRPGDPAYALDCVPRVDSYRGFVFASMAPDGPGLAEYLGDIAAALDNMADRAPDGTLSAAGGVLRQEYRGNWKLMMENTCDLVHPGFVHASSVASTRAYLDAAGPVEGTEQAIQMINANGIGLDQWDARDIHGFENGHCYMDGFYKGGVIDPALDAPVFDAYKEAMDRAYGAERVREILARETFNNLIYPNVTVNTRYQFLRVIQPVAVDLTHVYSYCFRLGGAPAEMFPMSVRFVTTVSSPSSLIASDDLSIFESTHRALDDTGPAWLDYSRRHGQERQDGDAGTADIGTSELPMRTMMRAWRRLMAA